MRRVILLALLALALPTTALANGISNEFGTSQSARKAHCIICFFDTGSFASGTITPTEHNPFMLNVRDGHLIAPSRAVANLTPTIPEPGTVGLFGTGLIGLAWLMRRKLGR